MNMLIANLRNAAAKRATYRRTLYEIERMPLDMALDLNIYPGDAHKIAYDAVYG